MTCRLNTVPLPCSEPALLVGTFIEEFTDFVGVGFGLGPEIFGGGFAAVTYISVGRTGRYLRKSGPLAGNWSQGWGLKFYGHGRRRTLKG
jgi:hypothetical protein